MNARLTCLTLTSLLVPILLAGASIEGPQLGLVFDVAHHELRPIQGIPGSAILGRPLELGVHLLQAAVSSAQDYVLGIEGDNKQVIVLQIRQTHVAKVAVPGADQNPDQLVLSASGRAAALYQKDRNLLQLVTGLPTAPKIAEQFYLSPGSSPEALAIGDDGRTVLAAVGSRVFLVTASGEVPVLQELSKVTAMNIPSADTAYVVDGGRNLIHRLRGLGGNLETDIVAGSKQLISNPVALAASDDGGRIFVANGKSRTVAIISLSGHTGTTLIACGCTPTGLDRLAGGEIFRLTEPSNLPMWVLEATGHQPRVLFVPASSSGSNQK